MQKLLSRTDELMLIAVWRLQASAYAVEIQQCLREMTGETWSFGSIYVSLERLTDREYVTSALGDPTSKRGGRAKRIYTLTRTGRTALVEIRQLQSEVWEGISLKDLNPLPART